LTEREEEKRGVNIDLGGMSLKREAEEEEKRGVNIDLGGMSLKREAEEKTIS
jgi:selenocysteine-specific translation elongation factor